MGDEGTPTPTQEHALANRVLEALDTFARNQAVRVEEVDARFERVESQLGAVVSHVDAKHDELATMIASLRGVNSRPPSLTDVGELADAATAAQAKHEQRVETELGAIRKELLRQSGRLGIDRAWLVSPEGKSFVRWLVLLVVVAVSQLQGASCGASRAAHSSQGGPAATVIP